MFKRLFEKLPSKTSPADIENVHMPEVDVLPNIEEVFDAVRKTAAGEAGQKADSSKRNVIIVTPGRMMMFHPCPKAGSMPGEVVVSVEAMISSAVKRNIVAIAYTQLDALMADVAKAIPFLGFLVGFAYAGHAVWVFEGHPSALAAGCRDADVLIVDGAMVPHLSEDWVARAASAMRNAEIYIHDRATYSLHKVA
jgi:hypothetical protein